MVKIFRETEIRPSQYDKARDQAYAKDLRWLQKRIKEFVKVKCPACGSRQARLAWRKNKFQYLRCKKCETVYVSPRAIPQILKEFYENSEGYKFWNKYIFPASEPARRKLIFRPRVRRLLELCKKYGTKRGLLVEVGAGFGTFAQEVKKTGFFKKVTVVEPAPNLASSCRKKGLEVIEKPVEEAKLKNKADVVAAFEVIEHLFSPRDFILACRKILSKNGLLIVTCPSIKGFDNATLGPLASAVDHEHINYFHPESLAYLFKKCGFEAVEVQTPGKLDAELVRNAALAGKFSLKNYPFLQQVLINHWKEAGENFQRFLAENNLSSHLWVVGRKL